MESFSKAFTWWKTNPSGASIVNGGWPLNNPLSRGTIKNLAFLFGFDFKHCAAPFGPWQMEEDWNQ